MEVTGIVSRSPRTTGGGNRPDITVHKQHVQSLLDAQGSVDNPSIEVKLGTDEKHVTLINRFRSAAEELGLHKMASPLQLNFSRDYGTLGAPKKGEKREPHKLYVSVGPLKPKSTTVINPTPASTETPATDEVDEDNLAEVSA